MQAYVQKSHFNDALLLHFFIGFPFFEHPLCSKQIIFQAKAYVTAFCNLLSGFALTPFAQNSEIICKLCTVMNNFQIVCKFKLVSKPNVFL